MDGKAEALTAEQIVAEINALCAKLEVARPDIELRAVYERVYKTQPGFVYPGAPPQPEPVDEYKGTNVSVQFRIRLKPASTPKV